MSVIRFRKRIQRKLLNARVDKMLTLIKGESNLKILLDEMYAGLKEYFETLGWEAMTAQEAGLKGAKDKDIVEYARKNNALLVTQDQKPADLAELTGVRYVLISSAMIAKIADEKIREKYLNASKNEG
jgi:predicted nuclease of predicted toxin-antitoxin system